MLIATDQRSLRAEPDHEGGEQVAMLLAFARRRQCDLAKLLLKLERKRHFALHGYASLAAWTRFHGLGDIETRQLLDVAHAMDAAPGLRAHLIGRRISFEAAALLGTLARATGTTADGRTIVGAEVVDWDRWLTAAQNLPSRDFRRRVKRECEAIRQQTDVIEIAIETTERTRTDFRRAQDIASRRHKRMLTAGETLGEVTNHYLDSFDPLRRAHRIEKKRIEKKRIEKNRIAKNRVQEETADADTGTQDELPFDAAEFDSAGRHIPAATEHAVRIRAHDHCEVPGCAHGIHLEFAHIVPHRQGGTRTPNNLLLLCNRHHLLFDSGVLRLVEARADGFVFEGALGGSFEPPAASMLPSVALSDADPP